MRLKIIIYLIFSMPWFSHAEVGNISEDKSEMHFGVRGGAINYAYNEPGLMKISGTLATIGATYRRGVGHADIPMWFSGDFDVSFGNQSYNGADVNTATGVKTPAIRGSKDSIYDLQGLYGATFFDSTVIALDTFAGLGIWYLWNKVDGSTAYTRQTTYLYLPIGTKFHWRPSSSFTWSAGAQLNVFGRGLVRSSLSEVSSSYEDTDNNQTSGIGSKLSTEFEYKLSSWSLCLEIYHRRWDIDRSDGDFQVVDGKGVTFYEPKNTTRMTGAVLGARF